MSKTKKLAILITAGVLLLAILVTGGILLTPKTEYYFGKEPDFQDPYFASQGIQSAATYPTLSKEIITVQGLKGIVGHEEFFTLLQESDLVADDDYDSRSPETFILQDGDTVHFLLEYKGTKYLVSSPIFLAKEVGEGQKVYLHVTPLEYGTFTDHDKVQHYWIRNPEAAQKLQTFYDVDGREELDASHGIHTDLDSNNNYFDQ